MTSNTAFVARLPLALAVVAAGLVVGCDCTPERAPEPVVHAEPAVTEDRLVVFAATSLRDAFTAMGTEFERVHPGVTVTFNFAGTQELRTQLEQGAAVDVFASADQVHMGALVDASRASNPVVFARNEPVVVVASEAAAVVRTFADLPAAERIVIGAPEVPIGRYTLQMFDRASATLGADFRTRVEAHVVSRELNVRQVLAKIRLGEAQAGVVYRTDAQSAEGEVTVVAIPAEINVTAEYPIAIVSDAAHPALARAFVAFVSSAEGQAALRTAGFLAPSGSSLAP